MPLDSKVGADATVGGGSGGGTVARDRPIKVAVAHADVIVRAGLHALLGACGALNVAPADAPPPLEHSDIIIFDYQGGLDYLQRSSNATQDAPLPRVLVVTQQDKEWDLRTAMQAGVHGYLMQSVGTEQLLTALHALSEGRSYVGQELRGTTSDALARASLTGREADVLRRLSRGDCNKQIARALDIGVGTVKTHVKGVCTKLGATTRTQAVVLAMRRGLV